MAIPNYELGGNVGSGDSGYHSYDYHAQPKKRSGSRSSSLSRQFRTWLGSSVRSRSVDRGVDGSSGTSWLRGRRTRDADPEQPRRRPRKLSKRRPPYPEDPWPVAPDPETGVQVNTTRFIRRGSVTENLPSDAGRETVSNPTSVQNASAPAPLSVDTSHSRLDPRSASSNTLQTHWCNSSTTRSPGPLRRRFPIRFSRSDPGPPPPPPKDFAPNDHEYSPNPNPATPPSPATRVPSLAPELEPLDIRSSLASVMQLWMSAESSLHRRGSLPIFPKVDNKATKRPTDLSAVPAPDYNQSKMLQTVAEDNFRLRQIIRLCDWLHDHPQDETTPPNVIFERIGTLKSMLHPPFEASARADHPCYAGCTRPDH